MPARTPTEGKLQCIGTAYIPVLSRVKIQLENRKERKVENRSARTKPGTGRDFSPGFGREAQACTIFADTLYDQLSSLYKQTWGLWVNIDATGAQFVLTLSSRERKVWKEIQQHIAN